MNTTSARKTKRFAPFVAPHHLPFRISMGNRKFFGRTGNGHKYSHFIQFNDEILPVVRWRNRQFEQIYGQLCGTNGKSVEQKSLNGLWNEKLFRFGTCLGC